ncbi:MAG: preprotein translocase subunit YajC [Acidimicrobiales bacterium]|nr:preprotein translocase subunit YajC [Acidimicrobiales bacterium]
METIILFGLFLVVYAVLVLPGLKRKREARDLLASLSEGDEVILDSGLHGIITALDGGIIYLEVSEGVEMKYARSSVAARLLGDTDESGDEK